MKKTIVALMLPLVMALAVERPEPKKSRKPAAVPADATEVSSGVYRHTDSQGKTWLYRNTPFGISKSEETQASSKEETASGPSRQVDAKGKVSVSNPSPFGVSKVEERGKPSAVASAEDPAQSIKTKDLGDRVQFERSTPFGPSRWERKKSELTEIERAAWERHGGKSDAKAEPRP